MDKRKVAISTGIASGGLGMGALAYIMWKSGNRVLNRFGDWKKEKIQDAYYNTLTEKDVAWG